MYYRYDQNNSNGYYLGPEYVIIEAEDKLESSKVFNNLNLDNSYCECCGERWTGISNVYSLEDLYREILFNPKWERMYYSKESEYIDELLLESIARYVLIEKSINGELYE